MSSGLYLSCKVKDPGFNMVSLARESGLNLDSMDTLDSSQSLNLGPMN